MGSEFCPNFAFVYKRMIGIQGHPEFTPEYSAALANARRSRIGDARVDEALDTLSEPLNARPFWNGPQIRWRTHEPHVG